MHLFDCQLFKVVRAPDCGSGGRGFETHLPPHQKPRSNAGFFILLGFQRINQSERVWLIHSQRNKFFVSCDSFATRSFVEVVVFGRGFREKDKNFYD